MVEAEKRSLGRDLNEICPTCRQGRLKIVTKTESGSNDIIGPGGRSWSHTKIEFLACSACGILYASKDRGTEIYRRVEEQAINFANPDTQPTTCPRCEGPLETRSLRNDDGIGGYRQASVRAIVHYCPDCLIVVWVEEQKTRSLLSDGVVDPQFEESVRRALKERGIKRGIKE